MKFFRHQRVAHRAWTAAFTLVEVMIATTIFFMAMFTILGVLSAGLHAASILRSSGPTAGMVAGKIALTAQTNVFEEGSDSGDFRDIPIYEGYRWVTQTTLASQANIPPDKSGQKPISTTT